MTNETFTYELLCIDSSNLSKIRTVDQLAYSLMSNSDLLKQPKYESKQRKISDDNLMLTIDKVDTKNSPDFASQNSFRVVLVSQFNVIEKARIILITHIRKQDFPLIYVLTDEVSEKIAQTIYPKINKVESKLRRYLMKFFATKLGADWWKLTADADMQIKAQQRKNNEIFFAPLIDNKAYLIDFGELGKIIYTQSSGFINKDDIIKKVMSLDANPEAVSKIKEELQSNYTKYFKSTFKEVGFQGKWEQLEKIRHKVAHNNLFNEDDLQTALKISNELIDIIENADRKVEDLVFSQTEEAAIEEAIVESTIATEQEEASDWRTAIKNAIQALGGEAELSQIYEYISQNTTNDLPISWRSIIRWTLQVNSSDSPAFSGKHDVFRRIAKGKWGIRNNQS